MKVLIFFILFKANLGYKDFLSPLACSSLKYGDVAMKEIITTLRENRIFYSHITPFIYRVKGAIEDFEIPSDVIRNVKKSGNYHLYGECRIGKDKAYLFLSFDTPYEIERIIEREIKLKRVSQIKKLEVVKEKEDGMCEVEELPAKEVILFKFSKEVKKVELIDSATDLPFIIIPLSGSIFPEIPSAPPSGLTERRIANLINAERRRRGLKELLYSEEISSVSRKHSEDMAKNRFFSHFSPNTGSPSDRMKKAGIGYSKLTENIGLGSNADEIHLLLMDSPAHKCNIIDPEVEKFGVGAYFKDDEWWITENFIREKKTKDDFELTCSIIVDEKLSKISDELFKMVKSSGKISSEFLESLLKKYQIPYRIEIQYLRGIDPSEAVKDLNKPCSVFYKKYGEEEFVIIIKK